MNQELEILESFILKKINPDLVSCISDQILDEFQSGILNEKIRIQDGILKDVFNFRKDSLIRIYIQNLQNKFIFLADTLYDYLKEEDPFLNIIYKKSCLLSIQKSVYNFVLELLTFIEKNFHEFVNPESKIPDGTKFITIHHLKERLKSFDKIRNQTYNELKVIVTAPLKEFFENHISINSEQLHYFNELANACSGISIKKDKDPVLCLLKKLIFINFNSIAFFNFITDQIKTSLNSIESSSGKLEKLSLYLKKVNQAQVNPELCYIKNARPIKDMLAQWIVEEIIYYERLLKNRNETAHSEKDSDFKITTCFSVSQLACFLKILVETGIISNQNDMDIIRFFATVTKSKRTESISFNSLRTKYYNIDDNTREDVKDFVLKMLNSIRQQTNIIFLSGIFLALQPLEMNIVL